MGPCPLPVNSTESTILAADDTFSMNTTTKESSLRKIPWTKVAMFAGIGAAVILLIFIVVCCIRHHRKKKVALQIDINEIGAPHASEYSHAEVTANSFSAMVEKRDPGAKTIPKGIDFHEASRNPGLIQTSDMITSGSNVGLTQKPARTDNSSIKATSFGEQPVPKKSYGEQPASQSGYSTGEGNY